MRLSLDWLSEFVTWKEKDPAEIARRLTLSVAEVEGVEREGALLHRCCVGRVRSVLPHPNADKLRVADVDTDDGVKRVVCGGTNLREGMLVAFAHVGATVKWHGADLQTLAPASIRGQESHGMICAGEELDLAERFPATPDQGERPILDLTALGLTVGDPLREALGLTDVLFDVNNTAITNRPDLFSHLGFARECVAAGLAAWKGGKEPAFRMPKGTKAPVPVRMVMEAKDAVPRYLACAIEIEAPGTTPEWMAKRLSSTGFRPLLLPVDITNYVSHEIGMPLHAFDIDDLHGPVRCRYADAGETVTTLDGVQRTLPADALVLTDDRGNFDLVGIMGGLRSSTKERTRRIYLHSAVVEPAVIRATTGAINHRTDASTVYEKGIPPVTAEQGFARAVELFLQLVPGARVVSAVESMGKQPAMKAITLREERIAAIGGVKIAAAEAKKTLTTLGCTVKTAKKGAWSVTPPPWRAKDLTTEEDLIDDILRLHGYDRMEPTLPLAPVRLPERDPRTARMRHALAAAGYNEILPLSLVSEALLERAGIGGAPRRRVQSPLSEDLAVLQPSTLPGLLEHARKNLLHVERHLRTFRLCTVFSAEEEHLELGALAADRSAEALSDEPVLTLLSDLRGALGALGIAAEVRPAPVAHGWMHPGRAAELRIGDDTVGTVAALHPAIAAAFDLPASTAVALAHWSAILAHRPAAVPVASPPAFPAVTYDVTVARGHDEPVGPLLGTLRAAHPLVESVRVQDLFNPTRESRYRLTLRCTYRAPDRTLTEQEAQAAHAAVLRAGHLTPLA